VVQNFSKALRIGFISFISFIKRDESDSQSLTKINPETVNRLAIDNIYI